MPAEGIVKRSHDEMMRAEEMLETIKAATSLGIRKIRITGGEPLVKKGIVDFCDKISDMPGVDELCMTTNGVLLGKYACELREAGLDRINISIDTLDPDKFKFMTRIGDLSEVLDGIAAAFKADFRKIKINTVLIRGFNDDEIMNFIDLTKKYPVDVRFIEMMPIGSGVKLYESGYLDCEIVKEICPELKAVKYNDGVAELYEMPGSLGKVGLIKTISCGFCDRCNKLRLTADGMLKPCLHSGEEICLKGLSYDAKKKAIRTAIMDKPYTRKILNMENPSEAGRNMNMIGG